MAGRHRAPSKVKPRIIKTGITALAATGPVVLSPSTAQAAPSPTASTDSILAAIASCESGNRNILTGIVGRDGRRLSTAGGYWQIVNGTWKAHGGTQFAPTAVQASYAQQLTVARRILTQGQGISAWSESKSCWSKRIGKVSVPAIAPKETPPPPPPPPPRITTAKPREVVAKRAAASYVIRRGDTLSKIARRHGTTVAKLANLNRSTVKNVNRIYTGATLRLR